MTSACLLCGEDGTVDVRNPTTGGQVSLCLSCSVALVEMLLSMFPDVVVHQIMVTVIGQRGESHHA